MNYKYPLYAPWYNVELGKKTWGHTMSNLFKMINVKDHEDGSFTIEWDENDPQESIFNDWTKEDFVEFFRWCAKRENAKESGEESQETYYNSESEGKDLSEGKDFYKDYYIQATNEDTYGPQGDELSED